MVSITVYKVIENKGIWRVLHPSIHPSNTAYPLWDPKLEPIPAASRQEGTQ